ncbi:MAG: hypothetical protein F6K30_26365 [Cyanothece sp. SIO2G6]|nr:hypothetical protein [Cyanothece sp. SIO2G6]
MSYRTHVQVWGNGTDIRLVGSAHPTVYQYFQRSQSAYVSAIEVWGIFFHKNLLSTSRTHEAPTRPT